MWLETTFERCAQCSARRFQVYGVLIEPDEHGLPTPCQPVGLHVIWGFTWLLGLCLSLRTTALQDGKGVLLVRQKDSRAERHQHDCFQD